MTSWYEVLGVPPNASVQEIHHAYQAKAKRLHPDRSAGAPGAIVQAATDALTSLNEAWRVLGDPARRAAHDRQLQDGPSAPTSDGSQDSSGTTDQSLRLRRPASGFDGGRRRGGSVGQWVPGPLGVVLAGMDAVAEWLSPRHKEPKMVRVPDLRGMKSWDAWYTTADADLHMNLVQLTDNPAPVEGVVVDQQPAPGQMVRRHSTLTARVRHPPASEHVGAFTLS